MSHLWYGSKQHFLPGRPQSGGLGQNVHTPAPAYGQLGAIQPPEPAAHAGRFSRPAVPAWMPPACQKGFLNPVLHPTHPTHHAAPTRSYLPGMPPQPEHLMSLPWQLNPVTLRVLLGGP